jgi:lipoprotein-anchoring transpeptidase ErfK/SrfK
MQRPTFAVGTFWGRRAALLATAVAAPLAMAGCNAPGAGFGVGAYSSMVDSRYTLPAVPTHKFNPKFLRQIVSDNGREKAGTVIVDTDNRFLYFVLPNRKAVRYGIGVGKEGMAWGGRAVIGMKKQWPTWTPTANMVRRDPKLKKFLGGFKPGIGNPLGARAHYLYRNGRDSNYRIHGTNEPFSIGTAVSSGCIRMLNHDVIDLYRRTKVGTKVIVRHGKRNIASL